MNTPAYKAIPVPNRPPSTFGNLREPYSGNLARFFEVASALRGGQLSLGTRGDVYRSLLRYTSSVAPSVRVVAA